MGSYQAPIGMRSSALLETSCGYLLKELQMIWNEVGQDQFEREKVLLDLEQDCLEVYRKKVDAANISRALLHQELAEAEAEFTHLLLSLGEQSLPGRVRTLFINPFFQDENRYSVSRGAHKNLRRAERARILVNKIPALVDMLIANTKSWEDERKKNFLYDEVPLLAMLEEYNVLRLEKEDDKQRQREMKKVQSQVAVEQENLFITRPSSSSRRISTRSVNGGFGNAMPLNRRLSLGLQQLGANSINSTTQGISFTKVGKKAQDQKMFTQPDLVSHPRDETASVVSTFSGPQTP